MILWYGVLTDFMPSFFQVYLKTLHSEQLNFGISIYAYVICVIQVIIKMKITLVIKQNVFSSKNNALLRFLNPVHTSVHEGEKLFINILRYFLEKKK